MGIPGTVTQRLVAACVIVAILAAGVTAWRVFDPPRRASPLEWRPQPHLSESFNASMEDLWAALNSKALSEEDAGFALALLDRHRPDLPEHPVGGIGERTPAEEEARYAVCDVYVLMGERLRFGGISEETRLKFAARLIAALDSTKYNELMVAIQQCCYGRLVADDAVRQRVVELQSHENEAIRSQAVRQLAHYDKIADLERRGRWRERPPNRWR